MAFFRKAGSMLGNNPISRNVNFREPSIFGAVRWMSSSKLFIGGLSWSTDEQSLKESFSKYGEVIDGRVITDRETGRSRGFGFITYSSAEEASAAIQAMDHKELHGRPIRVDYATDRARGFSGGYNSGGNYGSGGGGGGYRSTNYSSGSSNFGGDDQSFG